MGCTSYASTRGRSSRTWSRELLGPRCLPDLGPGVPLTGIWGLRRGSIEGLRGDYFGVVGAVRVEGLGDPNSNVESAMKQAWNMQWQVAMKCCVSGFSCNV